MKIDGVSYAPLRGKVTRAARTKDPERILRTAREVVAFFKAHGWPDNWPSWRNDLADGLEWGSHDRNEIEEMFG